MSRRNGARLFQLGLVSFLARNASQEACSIHHEWAAWLCIRCDTVQWVKDQRTATRSAWLRMQGENRYELDETRTCVPVFLFQLPCCLDLFELISNTLFLLSDDIALKRHSHCFKERVRLVLPTSYTYTPFNTRPLYRSFNHFALSLNNSRQPLKQQKPRQRQKKKEFSAP